MLIKLFLLLFIMLMLASLVLGFLRVNQTPTHFWNTKNLLMLRAGLALLIVLTVVIGLATGQLTVNTVPW